jgi:hypothetical protein
VPEEIARDTRIVESFFRAHLTLAGISFAVYALIAREPLLARNLPFWGIALITCSGALFLSGGVIGTLHLMTAAGKTPSDLAKLSIFSISFYGLFALIIAFLLLNMQLYQQLLTAPTPTPVIPTPTPTI